MANSTVTRNILVFRPLKTELAAANIFDVGMFSILNIIDWTRHYPLVDAFLVAAQPGD